MVDLVLSVAVFLLTIAVVGLFAMMGELASRVPQAQDQQVPQVMPPEPISEIQLGVVPPDWPTELAHLSTADRAVIVVLSTLCTSCGRVASGQTGPLTGVSGLIISCPRPSKGNEFLSENPMLRDHRVALDVAGEWLTTHLGIDVSPSVLVFERGRLLSAHTFVSAASLHLLPAHHDEKEGIRAGQTTAA